MRIAIAIALPFGVIVIVARSRRPKSYGKVSSATITITPKDKAMNKNMLKHDV